MAIKEPAYSERDLQTIRTATHIVLKAWIEGIWREAPIYPSTGELIADFLASTQETIRSKPEYSKAIIYLVGSAGGSESRLAMPKGFVPEMVRGLTNAA